MEEDHSRGFWQRWYWPTVSLAALLAFELTASPTLSAILLCCHFGLDDGLTGVWLWQTDPNRGRGRACAWFSFARAVARILLAALLLLMLLLSLMAGLARQPLRGPPGGLLAVNVLLAIGLPLSLLLTLVACLSARRHSVQVWLDRGLHDCRRAGRWPVSVAGDSNLAVMPYLTMVVNLLIVTLVSLIVLITALDRQKGPGPGFNFGVWAGIFLVNVALLWLMVRSYNQVLALGPDKCWEPRPFPSENLQTGEGPLDHTSEIEEIPGEPVDDND